VTQHQKLLQKMCNNPKHVRYKDLVKVLQKAGCVIHDDGAGSHVTVERDGQIQTIVRPHRGDDLVKPYQVRRVPRTLVPGDDEE